MKTTYLTFDQWAEKYKPIKNELTNREEYNGWMFETFDKDDMFIRHFAMEKPNQVWTILTGGECGDTLVQGFHYVDRFCHFITEIPFSNDENVEILLEGSQEFDLSEKEFEDFIDFLPTINAGDLVNEDEFEEFNSTYKELLNSYRCSTDENKFINFQKLFVYVHQNVDNLDGIFDNYLDDNL